MCVCEGGREHVGRTARTLTTPIFGGRRAAELEISVLLGEGGQGEEEGEEGGGGGGEGKVSSNGAPQDM